MLLGYKPHTIGKHVYFPLTCATYVRKMYWWVEQHRSVCVLCPQNIYQILCVNCKQLFLEGVWQIRAVCPSLENPPKKVVIFADRLNGKKYRDKILEGVAIPNSILQNVSARPTKHVYQKLVPPFGGEEDRLACLHFWPQPHWSFVGSFYAICLH